MIEAFGLDSKIDNYKGVRPMSLYSWDLDCILDVLSLVLDDENEYPDKSYTYFPDSEARNSSSDSQSFSGVSVPVGECLGDMLFIPGKEKVG